MGKANPIAGVRLPQEVIDRVDALAERLAQMPEWAALGRISRSGALRLAVMRGLETLEGEMDVPLVGVTMPVEPPETWADEAPSPKPRRAPAPELPRVEPAPVRPAPSPAQEAQRLIAELTQSLEGAEPLPTGEDADGGDSVDEVLGEEW